MFIPHCFDPLISAKPKHPQVGALSQAPPHPGDEVAPPFQIPGLNLTQFNNIGTFRPNMAKHIPRPSTRACRARNLFNWPIQINWVVCHMFPHKASFLTKRHELSNIIPSSPHSTNRCENMFTHVRLNCNSLPHPLHETDHRSINHQQRSEY